MHRYLNLLTTDGGSVHHLLCLVGLLLGAVGDEGVPGGIEGDEGGGRERGGGQILIKYLVRGKLEKVGEQERTFEKVWGGMAQKKMSVLPFAAVVGVGDIAKPVGYHLLIYHHHHHHHHHHHDVSTI